MGGKGLEGLLQARQFTLNGVLNGIDEDVWNPEVDPEIPENFTPEDLSGKAWCKVRPNGCNAGRWYVDCVQVSSQHELPSPLSWRHL